MPRWCEPRSCFLRLLGWPTSKSPNSWTYRCGSSRNGASVSIMNDWTVWRTNRGAADRAHFPPQSIVEIKALACELPSTLGLPFSRLSNTDITREAVVRGIVVSISITTVWRWLHSDAIKPWMHHSWLSPRDPLFGEKAARVLDLYYGFFSGVSLGPCGLFGDSFQVQKTISNSPACSKSISLPDHPPAPTLICMAVTRLTGIPLRFAAR